MKKVFLIISLLTLATLMILPLQNYCLSTEEVLEELKLYVGEPKVISVNKPTRVVIGNPAVADVSDISANEMTIIPKVAGTTTLVFWDNFGEQSYKIKVFADDVVELKSRIDKLLARLKLAEVYTQLDEEEGKIFLMGRVKTKEDKNKIALILGPLKDKTTDFIELKEEEAAVEIAVQLLELDKDATTTLGFEWPGSISATGTAHADWGSMFKAVPVTTSALSLAIHALVQEGKARILSRPRLACQSGKEAELLVGGEKPIFTSQAVYGAGAATSVEYKEYGIKLKIKPTITEDQRIKLVLNVEVSEVGAAETIGSSGATNATTAKAYPLTKRNVSTELYLNDEQTMAIGGLIRRKSEEDIRKTPGLGDVPVLGFLFKKKTTASGGGQGERGDTELFITLTPKIIAQEQKVVKEEVKPELKNYAIVSLEESTPLRQYAETIKRRVINNLDYPAYARQANFQGTLRLSLHLSYTGALLDVAVKQSSGYKILDDNAVAVAKRIATYPPFPTSLKQKELWIDVPVSYQLD